LAPDLLVAEEIAEEFSRRLGLGMLQDFVDVRQEQASKNRKPCGKCGQAMEVHHVSTWVRKTRLGEVTVRDPYVYCRRCGDSERPLHGWLGTARETWSLFVQEDAVELAADTPCGKAVEKLAHHHPGVEMERTTALRMLHAHGQQARTFIDEKLADARARLERPLACQPPGFEAATELEVEFDGGMIPVATLEPIEVPVGESPELTPVRKLPKRRKAARWEEVKAGLVQIPGETSRLYTAHPTSGLDAAFDDLLGLAALKGWTEKTQVRGIADGALHIRPRMQETFAASDFTFILDRPHAKEHLSSAGEALAPMTGIAPQTWAKAALGVLESGDAQHVVGHLHQAWLASGKDEATRNDTLRREANYFERNSDAVAYADFRAKGWSTASSEIESSHRHLVQARLKISGAWWRPDTVGNVLALRMLKANGWWDEYWRSQRSAWRSRAHGPPEYDAN